MFNRLWSSATQDPPLTWAIALVMIAVVSLIAVLVRIVAEGRQAGSTTAAQLRQDAHTAERRSRLRLLQGRLGQRKAS